MKFHVARDLGPPQSELRELLRAAGGIIAPSLSRTGGTSLSLKERCSHDPSDGTVFTSPPNEIKRSPREGRGRCIRGANRTRLLPLDLKFLSRRLSGPQGRERESLDSSGEFT